MFATVLLAAVLATASPSLTSGPEVVLDPIFHRYPSPLSIGGTRDAIVVAGTMVVGSNQQAFYQIVDGTPHDRVLLTGRSEHAAVVTSGAETLVAWYDPTGTQILFPFHPDPMVRHVDNGIFSFAIPTPDGFRVFAHDQFANFSSVTINADGSSIGPSVDLYYALPPAVQSHSHLVFLGNYGSQAAILATPDQKDFEAIEILRLSGRTRSASAAANGSSALFLIQDDAGVTTWAVDLTGQPRVTGSQRILEDVTLLDPPSLAWTGTNYLVVWTEKTTVDQRTIRGLQLDADGKPASARFTIAGNADSPAVAGLGRGEAAVVYVTLDAAAQRLALRRLSPPPPAHRRAVR